MQAQNLQINSRAQKKTFTAFELKLNLISTRLNEIAPIAKPWMETDWLNLIISY